MFFGEDFKLQNKSVLYRFMLSVILPVSPIALKSGSCSGEVVCFTKSLTYGSVSPLQMVCERSDVFASSCAMARAFPIFSRRSASSRRTEKKHVTVEFVIVGQDANPLEAAELEVL